MILIVSCAKLLQTFLRPNAPATQLRNPPQSFGLASRAGCAALRPGACECELERPVVGADEHVEPSSSATRLSTSPTNASSFELWALRPPPRDVLKRTIERPWRTKIHFGIAHLDDKFTNISHMPDGVALEETQNTFWKTILFLFFPFSKAQNGNRARGRPLATYTYVHI